MSSDNPPYPYYPSIPFNPSFFTSNTGNGLTESTANNLYLRKTVADTATAQETFTSGVKADTIAGIATTGTHSIYATKTAGTLNIATSQTSGNINIGASGVTTTANGTLIANTINATGTSTPNIANITSNVDAGVNKGCSLQVGKNGANAVAYRLLLGSDINHSIYSTDAGNRTYFVEYAQDVNSWNFFNSSTGGVVSFISNTGTYSTLSDRNQKKDFEPSLLGLNEILQLKPTLYRYKNKREDKEEEDKQEPKSIGFIAQEVHPIIPHAYVSGDDFVGLNYNSFIPVLVKAVQEMKLDYEAKIQELKEDYDAKLSTLEDRFNKSI